MLSTLPLENLKVYSNHVGNGYYLTVMQAGDGTGTWVEYMLVPPVPHATDVWDPRLVKRRPIVVEPKRPKRPKRKSNKGYSSKRRIPLNTKQGRSLFQTRRRTSFQGAQSRPDRFLDIKHRSSNRARTRTGSYKLPRRCE